MKFVIGFVFAVALVAPAAAFEGCSKAPATASISTDATPSAPVQTAEAPSATQTK